MDTTPKINLTARQLLRMQNFDAGGRREWIRTQQNPREIQELLHGLSVHSNRDEHELGRMAIDILLAEAADVRAKNFGEQMDKLLGITEAQRLLASKLDRQTEKVIKLTWALVVFTIVLIAFGALDFIEKHNQWNQELKHESKAGPLPIAAPTSTNSLP